MSSASHCGVNRHLGPIQQFYQWLRQRQRTDLLIKGIWKPKLMWHNWETKLHWLFPERLPDSIQHVSESIPLSIANKATWLHPFVQVCLWMLHKKMKKVITCDRQMACKVWNIYSFALFRRKFLLPELWGGLISYHSDLCYTDEQNGSAGQEVSKEKGAFKERNK